MKKILFILITLFLTSCATLKDDIFIRTDLTEQVQPQLTDIEHRLVKQLSNPNDIEMQAVFKDLDELLATPSTDDKYLARVNALMADYYYLRKSTSKTKTYVERALKQNPYDEYALLVNAKRMKANDAIEYLEPLCNRFPKYMRLATYLGHVYAQVNEYAQAVAYFDASLPFLDKLYSDAYLKERKDSYAKYTIGDGISKTVNAIINKEKILLIDMTTLTDEITDAFNTITGNSKWKSSMLADRLKSAGWYFQDAQVATDMAKRKDVAVFLWHLLCINNESKLNMYSNRYRTRTNSPIFDVAIGSLYFDACLAMVENDIMQLTNGRYFEPELLVSGTEFYKYLQKVETLR